MSNADTRGALVAALDTVDGVRGFRWQPSTLRPGNAWPRWGGGQRDEQSMGFEETWRVTVVTAQGTDTAADEFLDAHGAALLAALSPVMFVDTYAPARLETEAGPLYALVITGRTE